RPLAALAALRELLGDLVEPAATGAGIDRRVAHRRLLLGSRHFLGAGALPLISVSASLRKSWRVSLRFQARDLLSCFVSGSLFSTALASHCRAWSRCPSL